VEPEHDGNVYLEEKYFTFSRIQISSTCVERNLLAKEKNLSIAVPL